MQPTQSSSKWRGSMTLLHRRANPVSDTLKKLSMLWSNRVVPYLTPTVSTSVWVYLRFSWFLAEWVDQNVKTAVIHVQILFSIIHEVFNFYAEMARRVYSYEVEEILKMRLNQISPSSNRSQHQLIVHASNPHMSIPKPEDLSGNLDHFGQGLRRTVMKLYETVCNHILQVHDCTKIFPASTKKGSR